MATSGEEILGHNASELIRRIPENKSALAGVQKQQQLDTAQSVCENDIFPLMLVFLGVMCIRRVAIQVASEGLCQMSRTTWCSPSKELGGDRGQPLRLAHFFAFLHLDGERVVSSYILCHSLKQATK